MSSCHQNSWFAEFSLRAVNFATHRFLRVEIILFSPHFERKRLEAPSMQKILPRLIGLLSLATLAAGAEWFAPVTRAGGPMGIDGGIVVSGSGHVNLTTALASNYVAGKTGWIRINMILTSGYTHWESTELGHYEQ